MNQQQDLDKSQIDQEFPKVPRLLQRHTESWLAAGLIEREHAYRLLEHSSQLSKVGGRNWMGVILSLIAGIFVLTGIILLIAGHWNGISRGVKLLGALGLLGIFQWVGWSWREHPDSIRRWMAQGFLLAGGGMILALAGPTTWHSGRRVIPGSWSQTQLHFVIRIIISQQIRLIKSTMTAWPESWPDWKK